MIDHCRPPIATAIIYRTVEKVTVKDQQVAGVHQHGHGSALVKSEDL
jgi:hypothetical protein